MVWKRNTGKFHIFFNCINIFIRRAKPDHTYHRAISCHLAFAGRKFQVVLHYGTTLVGTQLNRQIIEAECYFNIFPAAIMHNRLYRDLPRMKSHFFCQFYPRQRRFIKTAQMAGQRYSNG